MKITIVNNNEIIFEDNSNTMKDCVINAIASDADLRDADLGGAWWHIGTAAICYTIFAALRKEIKQCRAED